MHHSITVNITSSGKTYASALAGASDPSIRTDKTTPKEGLRGRSLDIGSASNGSDTSLGEGNDKTRRNQNIDSPGDETEDDYAEVSRGAGATKVNDEVSDSNSEVSSTASMKRKRSPKRGNRKQSSKSRES